MLYKLLREAESDESEWIPPTDKQFTVGLEIATDETFARTMKAPGSLRWGGYYGTEYLIDPQNDLVILLYTNKVSWYPDDVWDDFFHAVYMSLK